MNIDALESLAEELKGAYSPVADNNSDWDIIYHQGIAKNITQKSIDGDNEIIWDEEFSWFLIISIFLFMISLIPYRLKLTSNTAILPYVIFFIVATPSNTADAFEIGQNNEQIAYRAYNNGDYEKSETYYKDIDLQRSYYRYYGQANSLYKQGHYKESIQLFSFAILHANNDRQRSSALYNMANSYFRTGNFSLAINTYEDALRYQANNIACIYNLNVSKVLQKNIEQRLNEERKIILLSKQGRGPKSASTADNADINENTSVSLADDSSTLNENIPLPEIPNLDQNEIQKLLAKGLKNIKLANQGLDTQGYFTNIQSINIDLIQARQKTNKITDSQHLLWKRLFEIEEGFPAPVDTPHPVPRQQPW